MLVNTTLGSLLGVVLPAGCDQWLGVPYGHAARFQPAEVRTLPYATSPLPALDFGPACLQFLTNTTTYGSEHGCFVLNIWRPSDATPSDKLPVLVYVPGGENAFGEAGPYNASELAVAQRAVVVGVNYRVGPFGFLSFAEDVEAGRGTGNWAQTDVQAALQWVRREIGAFGGDPTRTTLFGQSSGGGLVLNHAFMPGSRGLVQGLLSQSALTAHSLSRSYQNTAIIAAQTKCDANMSALRACLEAADAAAIVLAQGVSCANPNVCLGNTTWSPAADGVALPGDPHELLAIGAIHRPLAVAVGANTNDTNLFVSGLTSTLNFHGIPLPIPRLAYEAFLAYYCRKKPLLLPRLLTAYPPHAHHPLHNHSDRIGWLLSDQMLCKLSRLARGFAKAGAGAYAYRHDHIFDSDVRCTAVPNYHDPALGPMHQDELSFVFGQPIFMDLGGVLPNCSVHTSPYYAPSCEHCVFDTLEAGYAHALGRLWTNFASTGDPNTRQPDSGVHGGVQPASVSERAPLEWPPVGPHATSDDTPNVLLSPDQTAAAGAQRMGSESAMGRADKCALWDAFDADSEGEEGAGAVRAALEAALRHVARE